VHAIPLDAVIALENMQRKRKKKMLLGSRQDHSIFYAKLSASSFIIAEAEIRRSAYNFYQHLEVFRSALLSS
jgi:hypothetical protein